MDGVFSVGSYHTFELSRLLKKLDYNIRINTRLLDHTVSMWCVVFIKNISHCIIHSTKKHYAGKKMNKIKLDSVAATLKSREVEAKVYGHMNHEGDSER